MYNVISEEAISPRQRLVCYGVETLTDQEILGVVLGKGEVSDLEIAENALDSMVSLEDLSSLSVKELEDIQGVDELKALQIKATLELSKRVEKAGLSRTEQIMSSQQVARRMMLDIGDKRQEHLVAIYLDTQNRIIQQKTVFIGGVRRSIAEPREILHYACHLMATSLIVVLNHPSGETYPSRNDLDFTDKLKRSCDDLGICLLDHLIIGKGTYYSFREEREDFEI